MGSRSEKWHAAIWAALVAIGSIEVFVLLPTSLRTAAIFSLIGFGLYVAVSRSWIVLYPDFRQRGVGYLFATLALMIVVHDAYFYWTHRFMHHHGCFGGSISPTTSRTFRRPGPPMLLPRPKLWSKARSCRSSPRWYRRTRSRCSFS